MGENAEEGGGEKQMKAEVVEPGTVIPVRTPGPPEEALVTPCVCDKIEILFYLTQSLRSEEKKGAKQWIFLSFSLNYKISFTENTGIR